MIPLRLIRKNLARRRGRTALTILGIVSAMLLVTLVESLRGGLERALSGGETPRTLIVYRQNRYCPQTSFLPERYAAKIERLPHVVSVLPVKVFLNNCRANLDIVAFQGTPVDRLFEARTVNVVEGDAERFRRENDAALVGREFALRRRLSVGESFKFGNIDVKVAGIFTSAEPVEEGVILTHLEFLQRATARTSSVSSMSSEEGRLGTVTQFEVKVDDASHAGAVAAAIDEIFRTDEAPTDTRRKIQFLETATRDLREVLSFASLLGIACMLVVLALVGNTIVMSVQERVREFGVFRTLGYHGRHVVLLILIEALLLAVIGAIIGIAAALAILRATHLTFGAEGVPVTFTLSAGGAARGLLLSVAAGLAAGLVPAARAARAGIVASLRST